jgi:CHASE1-domain containing sensor protein
MLKMERERKQKINSYLIFIVFLFAIGITFYTYAIILKSTQRRQLEEFTFRSEEISSKIQKEIKVYEQVLWSTVAFFNSSENIRRDEWKQFIDTLKIDEHWPGIQALGYAIPLLPSEIQAHENAIIQEGFADYQVHPQTPRDYYTSIVYIEPFDWRNQRAFGYDMWSDQHRQRAMQLSMATGEAYATDVITLIQETKSDPQKGFSIFAPVYKQITQSPSTEPTTLNKEELKGWVFAPFRINDFMASIIQKTPQPIIINIIDTTDSQDTPLYQESTAELTDTFYRHETLINVLGREWKIQTSTPALSFKQLLLKENLSLLIASLCIDFILLFFLIRLRQAHKNIDEKIDTQCRDILHEKNNALDKSEQLQQENKALAQQIALLQEWLQEREFRIKELKLENRSNDL